MTASIERVFDALINPEIIAEWSGSSAEMDGNIGTKFSLWDGSIHGTNLEVVPNEKLVQEWYGGKWEEPSKATFTLTENEGNTTVELLHENVPDDAHKNLDEGWRIYYLGPMQEMFG
ncbi:MAG: SRPBCC domain-containing protein [Bacteroidia bacterium]|nr:SRPBCC domain-containing protein [Bacteroidia bacterium]